MFFFLKTIHILEIYVYISEIEHFPTLRPNGALTPPIDNRHISPKLLAEYVRCHYINPTDFYSPIFGSLHARCTVHWALCSAYCHFCSLYSTCKLYLTMLRPTALHEKCHDLPHLHAKSETSLEFQPKIRHIFQVCQNQRGALGAQFPPHPPPPPGTQFVAAPKMCDPICRQIGKRPI